MAKCKLPRLHLERVELDRGGYEKSGYSKGRYWGVGQNLYQIYADSAEHELKTNHVRAANRSEALVKAKEIASRELCGKKGSLGMAKRRKRRTLKGTYATSKAANRRKYRKVASGSPVTRAVPRACAIVQSGTKKGKLRKGCRVSSKGAAHCDLLTKLPKVAWKTKGKYRYSVQCPS